MTRTILAALAAATLLLGCDDKPPAPPAATAAPTAAAPRPPAPATTPPATAGTAATPASAAPSALVPAKHYDCGAKGEKPCPMQGWMKKVMASAASNDDGAALAKALGYVADHPPPGYGEWVGLAKAGAAKARAGDVDGAKDACKQCHDLYKEKYRAEMRDRPF